MSQKNIEAIYPLSPMQQGILFHALYAPKSGVYFEQTAIPSMVPSMSRHSGEPGSGW